MAGRTEILARWPAALPVLRALVFLLAVPVLLGPHLPFFARLVAGPRAHVCHCDAHHTDCACPICFPDREDLKKNELAVRGPCGDEDPVFGATALPAVLPPPAVAVLPSSRVETVVVTPPPIAFHGPSPPEPPPPRA